MDPAELGDRVVAVLEEHPVVEVLGPGHSDGGVDRLVAGDVQVADELVEEQPAQALRRSGVPGEQCTLDDLGQIDEREDGLVKVRDVTAEDLGLAVRPCFRGVQGHAGP